MATPKGSATGPAYVQYRRMIPKIWSSTRTVGSSLAECRCWHRVVIVTSVAAIRQVAKRPMLVQGCGWVSSLVSIEVGEIHDLERISTSADFGQTTSPGADFSFECRVRWSEPKDGLCTFGLTFEEVGV